MLKRVKPMRKSARKPGLKIWVNPSTAFVLVKFAFPGVMLVLPLWRFSGTDNPGTLRKPKAVGVSTYAFCSEYRAKSVSLADGLASPRTLPWL